MRPIRSILSLILIVVATLLVSCGSPVSKVVPTYTPEKIAQIEKIAAPILVARDRMSELDTLIRQKNWVDTDTFIHGPLGELRQTMSYVSRNLLPKDQPQANELAKNLFVHFEKLDAAANDQNYIAASTQYNEALKDFDAYLALLPKS